MRFLLFGFIAVLVPLNAVAQNARVKAGELPPTPLKGEIHAIADPAPLVSFKVLCEHADLIVEGVVETEATRRLPGRNGNIETDFWIIVTRVIKGPPETTKLVTSELGGTYGELSLMMNYPMM